MKKQKIKIHDKIHKFNNNIRRTLAVFFFVGKYKSNANAKAVSKHQHKYK